jgi:RNAse (barnase) inhibitor barstar
MGLEVFQGDLKMAAAAQQATLREVDLTRVDGKAELMHVLAHDLILPPHFGRNWDALYDLLSDPGNMRDTVLCFHGWPDFARRHPELAEQFEGVLRDAQEALYPHRIGLWALI